MIGSLGFEIPTKVVNHWCSCRIWYNFLNNFLKCFWFSDRMKGPVFENKKNPLFACTIDLFVEFAGTFCSNGDFFCNSLSTATDVHCCLQEFCPKQRQPTKRDPSPCCFFKHWRWWCWRSSFSSSFSGCFFNLCTQTAVWKRVSLKPNYSSVAPWHLNRSPSHFWGSSHHFFNFLGWWCGFQTKIRT